MGSVGAAAPTIIGQWVQAMYSAPTIIWTKNPFSPKQNPKVCFVCQSRRSQEVITYFNSHFKVTDMLEMLTFHFDN